MGRTSTKENKNSYQLAREELGLTREKASELLETIAPERIEKIENERTVPRPDEVLTMAEKYKRPSLCNCYCSQQCPIGQRYVPFVTRRELPAIILEMLASLNAMNSKKERLIEIAADGKISNDEIDDFIHIRQELERISLTVETLQLWTERMLANGQIDAETYKRTEPMKVVSVKFKENGRAYYFDPGEFKIKEGDFVVVTTARGTECGEVVRAAHEVPGFSREVKPVIRVADAVDVRRMRQNRADVQQAYHICEQRIAAHNLKMKLVDAEYTLDRSKLVFYFTADNRVDFRELVKDLASQFHTRIELRQIGVRDESKMLGGLGLCGQPFCCSRFLKNFQPVSIKMAKEQGLSLNPAKISGSCGRLMCCLAYEQKSYEYLNSITPQVGSIVRTPDGEGTVIEVNVVAGTLKVRSNVEILAPRIYKRDECVYVRGGKRTPLPADKEDK